MTLAINGTQQYTAVGRDAGNNVVPITPVWSVVERAVMAAGEARLDLDYIEDSGAAVDMNIVMTGDGRFVELQGTAEDEPFTDDELDAMRELGRQGCRQLTGLQRAARERR